MKIVYLSTLNIPSRQANSVQVMRMCEAFAHNGHVTTLIARQLEATQTRDLYDYYGVQKNFQLVLIPCKKVKGLGIRILPKLYARLRQYDAQEVLIYARDIYGISLAVRMGFRAIYEVHSKACRRHIDFLEKTLLKNPRLIRLVVTSKALKTLYTSKFNIADRTEVCHNAAVIPSGPLNGTFPWPACRNTLQLGYTGSLYPGKGAEIIVECAKCLPQYDFHIVGGTENDVAFWKAHATSNVCFHGFLEPSLVHQAHARWDILLLPYQKGIIMPHSASDHSSWMSSLKLFEYMASRKAIIASDLPVLREVLNEQMAVLVSPDNPDEWIDAIRRCEDRSYRQSLAENAYHAFLQHYTSEKRAFKALEGVEV